MPLRLVGLSLGKLLLRFRSRLRVFTRGMLTGSGPATCGHKRDDDQRYGDQGDDDPRNHAGSVTCFPRGGRPGGEPSAQTLS